jgi:glycosyltransferase involved in cell wall biosynthesis
MKLALFFTFGISARLWKEKGLLDREKLIYEKLIGSGIVNKIYWLTYGTTDKEIEKELINGIEIIPMPSIYNSRIGRPLYSLLMPFIQHKYIRDADILKTNQMLGSWVAVLASKLYRKPLIVRTGYTWSLFASKNNTTVLDRFASSIEKISYRNADNAMVATLKDADYISKKYRINANRLKVIPNYIDTDLFSITNSNKYEDRIIFVGRLTEQKNLRSLIQALKGLPYRLDIYGSGKLKEALSQLAKSLNVKVNFMGNVPNSELPKILNQYPVFVLPSFYEGMPKALLEAMACGCAVIGTKVDGIRELIKDNINGILCDTTSESIRNTIEEVMNDKNLRNRLGREARLFVEQNFSLELVVEKELAVYTELYQKICK